MRDLFSVGALGGLLAAARMGSGLLITKAIALYSGPSGLLIFAQFQSLMSIANGFVSSPVGNGLVRYTSQYSTNGDFSECVVWWKASMIWCTLLILFSFLILIFGGNWISEQFLSSNDYSFLVILIALFLPFSALNNSIVSVVNGLQNFRDLVFIGCLSVILSTVITATLVVKYNILGGLYGLVLNTFLSGVVASIFVARSEWFSFKFWFGLVEKKYVKDVFGYVLMAITTAICVPLSQLLVRKIIINFEGITLAGQWQAVWKISQAYLSVITIGLSTYFLPRLSKINNVLAIKKEINRTLILITPILFVFGIFIYFFREGIISLLFSEEFDGAYSLIAPQLIGDFIKVVAWLYAYPMITRGATKWFIFTEVLFSLLFVSSVAVFLFFLNIEGAVYAYIFAYVIYLSIVYLNIERFSK